MTSTIATADPLRWQSVLDQFSSHVEACASQRAPSERLLSGIDPLDRFFPSLAPGAVIALAGRPAMGTSMLAMSWLYNVSRARNTSAGIINGDMARMAWLQRLACLEGETSVSSWRSAIKEDAVEPQRIIERLRTLPLVYRDGAKWCASKLMSTLMEMRCRHAVDFLVVDSLEDVSRSDSVTDVVACLADTARLLEMTVLVTCGLSKEIECRERKKPCLSDFEGSGGIEEVADLVLLLYRDDVYESESTEPGMVELTIARNRFGPEGATRLEIDDERFRLKKPGT